MDLAASIVTAAATIGLALLAYYQIRAGKTQTDAALGAAREQTTATLEIARETREAALASQRTAEETRRGWEEARRIQRMGALELVHRIIGHASEVGWSEQATLATKIGHSLGAGPRGQWFTMGQDLRGKIAASGHELPLCSQVADKLIAMELRGAPIPRALKEVEAAIAALAT